MRISRKAVAIFLVAAACVFALLALSLNTLIERNHDRIREEIQTALGRPLKFDQLQLSLWGGLGISATNLRIAEDSRFAATPFIQTRELRMKVDWLPLLWGRVAIEEFTLLQPEIQIIKSEAGKLNVSTFFVAAREAPPTNGARVAQPDKEPRRRAPVALSISSLQVHEGRIHYIDRAVKEPFEMQVQNLQMSLKGSALTGEAALKLAASLSETREQNISVEGRIGPYGMEREWTRYPLDLKVDVDSLLFPNLTRALPLLRDKIPSYFGIGGPLSIRANLSGTLERPKIRDLSITGPFFGATEQNASLKGDLDLPPGGSWADAVVQGKLVINPVKLDRLRLVPFLQSAIPAGLSVEGPLSVVSELSGRLEDLKVHALIKADQSEVRFGKWLKKDKGLPAQLELNLRNHKGRLVLDPSQLTLRHLKLELFGAVDESPERLLTLRLRLDRSNLSGWDGLIAPLSSYRTQGTLEFDLALKKNLALPSGDLDLRGGLSLGDVEAKEKSSGRGFDQLNSRVSFMGKQIRVERSSLRLGSSTVAFQATVPDLSRPAIQYTLWSPKLRFADVTGYPATLSAWMQDLRSTGVLQNRQGRMTLTGNVSSSQGSAHEIPYRNLEGEISWSPERTSVQGLSFRALGGTFQVDGVWETIGPDQRRLALDARGNGMDLKAFSTQKLPPLRGHVAGKLDLIAKLRAEGKNGSPWEDNLRAEGETEIREGVVEDINLVERVLGKVNGLPGISHLISPALPAPYGALVQNRDTLFDKLAATLTIVDKRIRARDLLLAAPDYIVKGEGWIGFDKTMQWDGELVMSPQFTQELMLEHRNVRYLLDPQGRLAVPFRLEGTLPQVQPKPDIARLTEQIQRGLLQRDLEGDPVVEGEEKSQERQDWIQKGLDALFGK